jgi:hypothetical protein
MSDEFWDDLGDIAVITTAAFAVFYSIIILCEELT